MNLEQWKELLLNDLDSPGWSLDPFPDIDYEQLVNFESEFAALVSDKTEEHNYGPSVGETDKTSQNIDQNQMSTPEAAQAIPSATIDDNKPDIGIKFGVVSDPHNEARPSRKVIPRTRVLNQQNENILSCKSGPDANNLKGKAVLGSLTPKERKRLADRRHRAKVKAKNQKIRDDFESVSKENDELKEKLHSSLKEMELLLLRNHGQRNVSSKRKAVFELNFDSVENKVEAMKMVGGLPDMVKITLNVKKRRLKLKGDFDVEALLHMLKMCCNAHLVTKEDVSPMPGPSTSASLRVSAVQLRKNIRRT